MTTTYKFQCQYCKTQFKTESRYLKHYCEQMKRLDEIQTALGQMALELYKLWFKYQRRIVPKEETFLSSRHYKTFIKIAKFFKQVRVPNSDLYVRLMTQEKIPPSMWTLNEAYVKYIEFLDRNSSPYTLVAISLDTLFRLADEYDCEIQDVFDVVPIPTIVQLIVERKLTPWLLLRSKKFRERIKAADPVATKDLLKIINPVFWRTKFESNPKIKKNIERYIKELRL